MKNLFFRTAHSRSGFALPMVLGVLVLLSVLVVGFLTRTTSENATAAGYKASVSTKVLADMVVGLVEGQINMATTQGYNVAWASQPGMIRTFDNTGNLLNAFKLYSAYTMIDSGQSNFSNDVQSNDITPLSSWTSNSALWTDLNAPVATNNGTTGTVYNYPIIDTGMVGVNGASSTPPLPLGNSYTSSGFSYTSPTGSSTKNQPLPMPVRWLYLLRDGTIVAPTAGASANSVNVSGDNLASNPIIGRIAFWTDDETCKVNINTASEGTYWDTPKGNAYSEQAMGYYQPTAREYQRYPGHPAMTCLSSILYGATPQANVGYTPGTSNGGSSSLATSNYSQIYSIAPRMEAGGSNIGTTDTYNATSVTPDVNRLYANLDELIFDSNRSGSYGLSKGQIEQGKFFLTAHSRAPETNLFNLPRIACWPVYALSSGSYQTQYTTVFDQLIGTCCTLNGNPKNANYRGNPYFFQRQDPLSATTDINITRNQQLFSYLQWLTSQNVPGFGGNFSSKFGADKDQILTEIFDYIRSTNLADDNVSIPYTKAITNASSILLPLDHGWVVPAYNAKTQTMGFGRAFTLSEFGIGFICNADGSDTTMGSNTTNNTALNGTLLTSNQKRIQACIVMNFFSPMMGWTGVYPDMTVKVTGLDSLQVNGQSLGLPASAQEYLRSDCVGMAGGRDWGGNIGFRYLPYNNPSAYANNFIGIPITITVPANKTMAFTGTNNINVSIYAGSTSNLIQSITIDLPSGTFPIPNLVTTGNAAYYSHPATSAQNWWSFSTAGCISGYPGRLNYISNAMQGSSAGIPCAGSFFRNDGPNGNNSCVIASPDGNNGPMGYDVLRTVIPYQGDFRMVAASHEVTAPAYSPHPSYTSSTAMMACTLTEPINGSIVQGCSTNGSYVAGIAAFPLGGGHPIPPGVTGPTLTGDFDTGQPRTFDGPYINKPDEGNLGTKSTSIGNNQIPYFLAANGQFIPGPTFFTPNRIMPSPGMFGSLPTGIMRGYPWQTLLFRPQSNHPNYSTTIPDHLIMDLFWMPVVEPYAISDQFSTAGKINMNYQIMPFTYITRNTGLRALLKSERVGAIKNSDYQTYHANGPSANPPVAGNSLYATDFRYPIDADETLKQFDANYFSQYKIFRSASEICDNYIVPSNLGLSATGMSTFWLTTSSLTGENIRERIYTTLYPRLTTKSNTFTIHFRVQSLKKSASADANGVWTEGSNVITGEYRGSTTIERFINPNSYLNNKPIPDYASNPSNIPTWGSTHQTLDNFYKWRVVETRQFAP